MMSKYRDESVMFAKFDTEDTTNIFRKSPTETRKEQTTSTHLEES